MSANRQILARPGGPSRSIQVNQKRSSARTMSAFVPDSRHWMRWNLARPNSIGPTASSNSRTNNAKLFCLFN